MCARDFGQLFTDNHKVAVALKILYCYFRTSQFHCRKFCIKVILPGVQTFQVTSESREANKKLWADNMKKTDHLVRINVDGIPI
jgi:hypothetical protein